MEERTSLEDSGERVAASAPDQAEDGAQAREESARQRGTTPFARVRGKGGSLELIFSQEALEPDAPVLVFHHIRKTAGTSLRHSLRASLGGLPVYVATPPDVGQEEYLSQLATWHIAYYDGLSEKERRRLRYVGGHTAGFLVTAMDRPVRALSMVREPLDQVLSRFFFVKNREWPLEDLRSDSKLRQRFVNAQARGLLEPHFDAADIPEDPDDPAAETWRSRLFDLVGEHYTLGVQDRFDASLAMFQSKFGFGHRQSRTLRVNAERPPEPNVDPEILDLLTRTSWLDRALYEHAVAELDRYFEDKPPEAQDPRRTPVRRRDEPTPKADPEREPAPQAPGASEEAEPSGGQFGSELGSIHKELGLIREEIRQVNALVKALERRRGRDERDLPTDGSADPVGKGKASQGNPSGDKAARAARKSAKASERAKP